MGLLVTGVTGIVERIYVITCIRPGWYKLFPQLVISFSFITTTLQKELEPVSEYPHDVTAAILVFQTNPSLLYFRCIFYLRCFAYLMYSAYLRCSAYLICFACLRCFAFFKCFVCLMCSSYLRCFT